MFALQEKIRILELDIDTSLELFQRCVMPIMLYGSEIWAYENRHIDRLDVLYKGFQKKLLNLFITTPSCMVAGELGQPDIRSLITSRQLRFWAKVANDDTPRLSKLLLPVFTRLQDKPIFSDKPDSDKFNFAWLANVFKCLNELELGEFFTSPIAFAPSKICSDVKRQLTGFYRRRWESNVQEHELCSFFNSIKTEPCLSPYLLLLPDHLRVPLAQFRTRCHNLPVTSNRYGTKGKTPASTLCTLCAAGVTGDEVHYIFHCAALAEERAIFIPEVFRDYSIENVVGLFENNDPTTLSRLANFVALIMSQFTREKPMSPLKVRETHTLRSGRVTKRPNYLKEFFV